MGEIHTSFQAGGMTSERQIMAATSCSDSWGVNVTFHELSDYSEVLKLLHPRTSHSRQEYDREESCNGCWMNASSKLSNKNVPSADSLNDILHFAQMSLESATTKLVTGRLDSEPAIRGIFWPKQPEVMFSLQPCSVLRRVQC